MSFDFADYDKELNLLVSLVGDKAGADHLLRTKDDLIKSKDVPVVGNPYEERDESAWEALQRKHKKVEYEERQLGGEATKLTDELHAFREQLKSHDSIRKDDWGSGHKQGKEPASSKLDRQVRKERAQAAAPIPHATDKDTHLTTQSGVGSSLADIFKKSLGPDRDAPKSAAATATTRRRPGHRAVNVSSAAPEGVRRKDKGAAAVGAKKEPRARQRDSAPGAKAVHSIAPLDAKVISPSAVRVVKPPPPAESKPAESKRPRRPKPLSETTTTTSATSSATTTPTARNSAVNTPTAKLGITASAAAASVDSSLTASHQAVDAKASHDLAKALMASRNKGKKKKPGVFDHLKKKKVHKEKEVVRRALHSTKSGIRLVKVFNINNAMWPLPDVIVDQTQYQDSTRFLRPRYKHRRPGPLFIMHTPAAFYELPPFLEEQFEKAAQLDEESMSQHSWSTQDQKAHHRQLERNHNAWLEDIVDDVEHNLLPQTFKSFADYSHTKARESNKLTSKKAIRKAGLMDKFSAQSIRTPQQVADLDDIVHCSFGEKHCVALSEDGTVWTWGVTTVGRLGRPTGAVVDPTPREVVIPQLPEGSKVVHVSAGSDFNALVLNTGQLFTWGCGDDGKLGHNGFMHMFRPTLVLNILRQHQKIIQVSCGRSHMLVLSSAGLVYSSGESSHGRLGNGPGKSGIRNRAGSESSADVNDVAELQVVCSLLSHKTIHIAAGRSHSMAVGENNLLYTCGKGINGCLGHGTDQDEWKFKVVMGLLKIKTVKAAGGGMHSAAITEDGTLYTWGTTMYGRLGEGPSDGDTVFSPTIVRSLEGRFVADVVCGRSHTAALVNEAGEAPGCGTMVYCFGDDEAGQLGVHDWDGGMQLPSYCNGLMLPWAEIPPQKRFTAEVPTRIIRIPAGKQTTFVAAGSSSSITAIIQNDRRPLPPPSQWFEKVCGIAPGNARRYEDRFEKAAFPNVESLLFATQGAVKYVMGWQSGEHFQHTVANRDAETIIEALRRARRPLDFAGTGYPIAEPGKLLVCGRANFSGRKEDDVPDYMKSAAVLEAEAAEARVAAERNAAELDTSSSDDEGEDEALSDVEEVDVIEGDSALEEATKPPEPTFFLTNAELKRKANEERLLRIEAAKANPRGVYGDEAVAASYRDFYYG